MQKKIVALAVAGLSTAAFAQTNVTIYGVADVSTQGFTASQGKAVQDGSGSVMGVQSNSSLLGFKGTEDLGNGLKALFQYETSVDLAGNQRNSDGVQGAAFGNSNGVFSGQRDSFLGLNTKYGTGLAGYVSTPFRQSLVSFDVMPGATGSGQIEKQMGVQRYGNTAAFASAVRATAIAYAMPTLYGFDASIAYTGSNNNGTSNATSVSAGNCANSLSACSADPQSAWGFNLGWTGYGVNIKGAFQQANNNFTSGGNALAIGNYTSYLVGAMYTGLPGLKVSGVYARNTLGTNNAVQGLTNDGAGKITNNQWWMGASYRMGNWEPRVSAVFSSDMDGSSTQQLGSRQWTANVGYYMSKRTQVYGLISNVNNSANQNYDFGQQTVAMGRGGVTGMNLFTYGAGVRTTF